MTFGMFNSAISIGEVMMPNTPKMMLNIPAVYSLCTHANKPSIRALGLNRGDSIKIPINPNMIPKVP